MIELRLPSLGFHSLAPGARLSCAAGGADTSDEELFERVRRADDHAAFGQIVSRYRARVTALARRMLAGARAGVDAEDVAQEAFVEAYRQRATFRRGAALRPWLYKIAVNRCLNHLRADPRHLLLGERDDDALRAGGGADDPAEIVLRRGSAERLEREVAALPPRARAVLVLRYLDDLSYQEIADACGLPLGTVKTQLHRARLELKRRLADHAE